MKLTPFLMAMFAANVAAAADISCRVVGVSDGDTVTCLTSEKQQIKVRLAQIDAPEKNQPFGERSKQALSAMVYGKQVTLQPETTDKYGRTVARVVVGGVDANLAQVKAGMAWVYTQYAREQSYFAAEKQARANRAGLWTDPNPIEPSKWRHGGAKAKAAEPQDPIIKAANKQAGKYSCSGKTVCREMNSCDEAYFYLKQCGLGRLDRDKDGVPCESICGG